MARRSGRYEPPPPPEIKRFASVEAIDRGIAKLQLRIKEIEALGRERVRHDGQRQATVASNISQTILDVFSATSPEYREHQHFHFGPGVITMGMEDEDIQDDFQKQLPQAVALVQGLIDRLQERRVEFTQDREARVRSAIDQGSSERPVQRDPPTRAALESLRAALLAVKQMDPQRTAWSDSAARALAGQIAAAVRVVFGDDSPETLRSLPKLGLGIGEVSPGLIGMQESFKRGLTRAEIVLADLVERAEERLSTSKEGVDRTQTVEAEHDVTTLRVLASKLTNADVKAYLEEAILCLQVGALRAAVVFVWAGAIRTIQERMVAAGIAQCEAAVSKHDPKARRVTCLDDFAYIKDVITLRAAQEIGLLDKSQKQTLEHGLDLRNSCGHPAKYQPGIKKASSFIEDIVGIVFA